MSVFSSSVFSSTVFKVDDTEDNGWLGGGVSDAYYHKRKQQLEELDRIDENIRRDKQAAFDALNQLDVPKEIEAPIIRKLDYSELNREKYNIKALQAEIQLLREYLQAQQLEALRQQDDELAFVLMLQ
jgi:hypothetical protein